MAIGERIKRIRTMRGMTLKYLGESVEFPAFKDTDKKRIYALFDILYIIKKTNRLGGKF